MKFAEPIYKLIGAEVSFYDLMPDTTIGTIKMGSKTYQWNNWADIVEPYSGTEVWATYTNQYYAGKAAVINRKFGKGTVTFVGPDTDDGALEKATLQKVYQQAAIPILNLPKGVILDWRDGFWIGVNYGQADFRVPVKAGAKILIGHTQLKPAEVIVWKD